MKATIALLLASTVAGYKLRDDQLSQRRITDEDGDGVEDNVHKSQNELDRYRKMVYGAGVEDMHNTHNGEVAGHVRYGEDP